MRNEDVFWLSDASGGFDLATRMVFWCFEQRKMESLIDLVDQYERNAPGVSTDKRKCE